MRAKWSAVVIMVATAVKLWLAGVRTLEAIGWAGHDDWWFLQRAISILHGHWLGPYNHLTLIKGQGYPLWVAFISMLHVPLLFAQQLLYALACFAVCRALAPSLRSSAAGAVLFVVLLFNPMSVSDDTSIRVTREGLYPALGLLVFAGAAGAALRLNGSRRNALAWAALCGIALALFWHTREESVWFVPVLAAALLVSVLRARWKQAAVAAALPVLIVAAAHFALVLANGLTYGVYAVVEFQWKPFLRAYGSLTSVRQHPATPRFPVPREVRQRVYAVSPAFAELRPFLEGQLGIDWRRGGADDLGGESFMWAFREAVEKAGYYARGSAAVRDYYERVAREIEAARLDGRLEARTPRASLIPPLLYGQRQATIKTWLHGLKRIPTFEDFAIHPGHSEGYDKELLAFAETTRSRLAPRLKLLRRVHLAGWALHADGPLDISVECADGTPVPGARVVRLPSPDVYAHLAQSWKAFEPARNARFDIDARAANAYLVLKLRGRPIERMALGSLPPSSSDPNVRFAVDNYSAELVEPELDRVDAFRLEALRGIGRIYQLFFPWFFYAAVLLYLPAIRRDAMTAILMAGLLAAIGARVLILSLIDVTSFYVFTAGYQSPEYPLVLIVAVVAARGAVVALRERRLSAR